MCLRTYLELNSSTFEILDTRHDIYKGTFKVGTNRESNKINIWNLIVRIGHARISYDFACLRIYCANYVMRTNEVVENNNHVADG